MSASLSLFEKEHNAREKYIYFICGVAGALIAYLGKDYKPNHPWTTHDTLTISTLGSLILAFGFGIGNILSYIQGISENKDLLVAFEEMGNFVESKNFLRANMFVGVSTNKKDGKDYTLEEVEAHITTINKKSEKIKIEMDRWFALSKVTFKICHFFLFAGFILLVCSKIVS